MDQDEIHYKNLEVKDRKRTLRWASLTVAVSVTALIVSGAFGVYKIYDAQLASNRNERISHYTAAQASYNAMIEGLSSSQSAVRALSVSRMTQFVQHAGNYDPATCDQFDAARNLVQALEELIISESPLGQSGGLNEFGKGASDLVLRVAAQLKILLKNPAVSKGPGGCKGHDAYLANVDLGGAPLGNFQPRNRANFSIVYSDLRAANLEKLDLTHVQVDAVNAKADLRGTVLTCANLKGATLGSADLTGADLTGADLTDADLSHTNVQADQIRHAKISNTSLPFPEPDLSTEWDDKSCARHIRLMTGMFPGQGYEPAIPCPQSAHEWSMAAPDLQKRFQGSLQDMVSFCVERLS